MEQLIISFLTGGLLTGSLLLLLESRNLKAYYKETDYLEANIHAAERHIEKLKLALSARTSELRRAEAECMDAHTQWRAMSAVDKDRSASWEKLKEEYDVLKKSHPSHHMSSINL